MVVITYSYNYSYKVDKLENFTKVYGYNEVLVRCGYNGIYGRFPLNNLAIYNWHSHISMKFVHEGTPLISNQSYFWIIWGSINGGTPMT